MNATGSAKPSLLPPRKQNALKPLAAATALTASLALGACGNVPYPPPHKTFKAQQAAITPTQEAIPPAAAEADSLAAPTEPVDAEPVDAESPETTAEPEVDTTPSWPAANAAPSVEAAEPNVQTAPTMVTNGTAAQRDEPGTSGAGIRGWLDGVLARGRDATPSHSAEAAAAPTSASSMPEEAAQEPDLAASPQTATPAETPASVAPEQRLAEQTLPEQPLAERAAELSEKEEPAKEDESAALAPVEDRDAAPARRTASHSLGERFAAPLVAEAAEDNEPLMPPPQLDQSADGPMGSKPEKAPVAAVASAPLDQPVMSANEDDAEIEAIAEIAPASGPAATVEVPEPPMVAAETDTAETETPGTETPETETAEADSIEAEIPEPAEPSTAGLHDIEPAAGEQLAAKPNGHELGARIVFESDSAVLTPEAQAELSALASALMAQENSKVMILGYSEGASGDDEASRARFLSLSRSMAVRRFLMVRGLPSNRLIARALGSQVAEGPSDRVDVMVGRL